MRRSAMSILMILAALVSCSPNIHLDFLGQEKLVEVVLLPGPAKEKVLMIDVEGVISSVVNTSLFSREKNAVSRVYERLERAAQDPSVKAVILRLDTDLEIRLSFYLEFQGLILGYHPVPVACIIRLRSGIGI